MGLCFCRRAFLFQRLFYRHGAFDSLFWAQFFVYCSHPHPHFLSSLALVSRHSISDGVSAHAGLCFLSHNMRYRLYLFETQPKIRVEREETKDERRITRETLFSNR